MTGTATVTDPFTDWSVPLPLSLEPAVVPMIRVRGRSRGRHILPASDFHRKAV